MSFELLHAKVNEWKLTAVCIVDPDDDDFLGNTHDYDEFSQNYWNRGFCA